MTQDQTPKPIHHKMEFLLGSTFTSVSLVDATFIDSHLMGAQVNDCNATGIGFDDVNLSSASVKFGNLTDLIVTDANMTGVGLSNVNLSGAKI